MAQVGHFPEALADRCIIVTMQRKTARRNATGCHPASSTFIQCLPGRAGKLPRERGVLGSGAERSIAGKTDSGEGISIPPRTSVNPSGVLKNGHFFQSYPSGIRQETVSDASGL
jgi:hypothetical protein